MRILVAVAVSQFGHQLCGCVPQTGNLPVPLHLRNAPTQLMAELGYSDGYKYPHDYSGHYISQQYMPDALKDTIFFTPADTDKVQKRR